ncbi:acyl-CoA/acyl-ACP dehydrogenase [Moraxella sp. FZLJ2107]|uniref:acyl-CoA dehydrogenase family protein n=1 Tax=unclassified Moraxella TaxID=2685852 RepID=UPI0020C8C1D1|nr:MULTISPECIES: acyl-CoA dehydrogenase family protein [unclassified Moraxella]UTO04473.1 acyl-CoA/acyl-ACP dehydrogenase [Moraxella sp. FZLJ2107]UTO23306.1 acyl-CoA/acyl-ACP dehydrogenase [Moraxella sp. FZLJ2109]
MNQFDTYFTDTTINPAADAVRAWQSPNFLDNIAAAAKQSLDPLAIDKGHYPTAEMAQLAKLGAFSAHLNAQGNRFGDAILATAKIGETCGTTGFLSWCHQVCALYLDQSDNSALKPLLASHAIGDSFGGTALSNPMKTFANIESMILRATKVDGGYVVSGTLPWISHIAPNQYCGAIARVDGENKDVFFLLQFDDARRGQWALNACPTFSGMEGSSTWQIALNDYFVPNDTIIADPAKPFIERVRGAFVLMQLGIGAGIIQGAINDIIAAEPALGHVNQYLEDQAGDLQNSLDKLVAQTLSLATTPFDSSKAFFLDVLDTRIQGAQLSLKATQAALLHQGAKGYLMTAAPQRRIREAHFVAIVTPAIKHLRSLSQQLLTDVSPA